jgi:hypothetical protein
MRLKRFMVNELASAYGKGITFIDIDETIFRTFAMINVLDKETGKVIKKLNNQEFNTYKLKDGEEFEFHEFRDAEVFNKTSIPIPQTVKRIKRMFQNIDRRGSKVVLLTARADFNDRETFLDTFRKVGIPIDQMYVERVGNFMERPEIYKRIIKNQGTPKSVSDAKAKVITDYLSTGEYRRVRLIDDDIKNIKDFIDLERKIENNNAIIDKVRQIHNIPENDSLPPIQFFGLLVKPDGSLKRITK